MSVDRPPLRLIHTSDVHIGDDLDPSRRLLGLSRVIDAAIKHRVDVALIVGDLFDSARVKQPAIDATLEQLARLDIPTLVTSGNHDCLDADTIYERVAFADAGSHVSFIQDPEGRHVVLDDLKLSVWARGLVDHYPGHRPLDGYRKHMDGYWQVVMAHGHYVPPEDTSERSSLISGVEIAELGCDYLALGHWHRYLDVSHNGVAAFYCGSPSEAGGSFASANLVTLDPESGVRVQRVALEAGDHGEDL